MLNYKKKELRKIRLYFFISRDIFFICRINFYCNRERKRSNVAACLSQIIQRADYACLIIKKKRICEEFDFISLFLYFLFFYLERKCLGREGEIPSRCNAWQNPTLLLTRMTSRDPVSVASCNYARTHTLTDLSPRVSARSLLLVRPDRRGVVDLLSFSLPWLPLSCKAGEASLGRPRSSLPLLLGSTSVTIY